MALSLTPEQKIARLHADLRMGAPVVIHSNDGSWILAAIETLGAQQLENLRAYGTALHLAITARRAETLAARAYDGDLARIIVSEDADLKWLQSIADPADDLSSPMKGPFNSLREGPADVHRAAIALCKQARLLPAILMAGISPEVCTADVSSMQLAELKTHLGDAPTLHKISSARVPLEVSEKSRVYVFRPDSGGEEHYAIEIGQPNRDQPVLSRLHSACFTGDLIGSLKCDCGHQLRAALQQMGSEGAGVLIYLNQEGRGIGLANKMRAYALQDQGFDTVDANHRLGFEDDERDFRLGSEILRLLGFSKARLMTNNPAKVNMMQKTGIDVVERVPLAVGKTEHNAGYLATKAKKSGHLL